MPTRYDPENNAKFTPADPMSDEAIWDLLSVYTDGEATPEEAAQVEALLHQQPSLTDELAFLRRTSSAVRTLTEVDPPYSLRTAIYAATTQRPALARRIGSVWQRLQTGFAAPRSRFALAAGACAAAGLAALLLLPHGQTGGQLRVPEPGQAPNVAALNKGGMPVSSRHDAPLRPVAAPVSLTKRPAAHAIAPSTLSQPAPRADKMLVMTLANLERQTVRLALAAKPAHREPIAIGHRAPDGLRLAATAAPATQKSHTVERTAADDQSSQFSLLPKMDLAYQHPTLAMVSNKGSDDTLGANIDGSHDAPSSTQPVAHAGDSGDNTAKHVIRVSLSQLPPDARHYVTTADIKRDLDARNLGFSRTTLEGIKRSQATFAVIGGKF